MPPLQCPACARFLKTDLVQSLVEAPASCPKCEITLTPEMFGLAPPPSVAPSPSLAPDEPPHLRAASVRPPDLAPEEVRDRLDPLAGWDVGVPVGAAIAGDERPFPTDTVVVLGAGVVGLVLGAVAGDRPGRDATFAALGGLVGAAVARRIWRLP